jgi:hypothetical protein
MIFILEQKKKKKKKLLDFTCHGYMTIFIRFNF